MKILKEIKEEDILYIDIETVSVVPELEKGTQLYESWEYKMRYSRDSEKFEGTLEETFKDKSPLYAEFGEIVCITLGKIKNEKIRLKSYASDNEKQLLIDFCNDLDKFCASSNKIRFAGHACKGFDLPYIMRRLIINEIELPNILDTAHLKPWETTTIDTMELWKGTGFYGASLLNIATALGLPSPKVDIDGSETSKTFWIDKDLDRIVKYCERDVITVINIIRKFKYLPILEVDDTVISEEKQPLLTKIYNTKKITKEEQENLNNMLNELTDEEKILSNEILSVTLPK